MNAVFYDQTRTILETARRHVYATANTAMVQAYWNIGKRIVEQQGGNERAEYGAQLIKELSMQLTADFGKGFTIANLKNMRQFYLTYPIGYAVSSQLTWTHYRMLMRVQSDEARKWYTEETIRCQWSSRQLDRQISTLYYERLLMSRDRSAVKQEADRKLAEVMDTYVRIYDELQRIEGDNPTIGIILCSEKNEAVAHYSILNDNNRLYASKYRLTLPTAEELQEYIVQERRRWEERQDIL